MTTRRIRDGVGLTLGTAIAVNEIFIRADPRETALGFAGLCLSGVFALWQDERRRSRQGVDS